MNLKLSKYRLLMYLHRGFSLKSQMRVAHFQYEYQKELFREAYKKCKESPKPIDEVFRLITAQCNYLSTAGLENNFCTVVTNHEATFDYLDNLFKRYLLKASVILTKLPNIKPVVMLVDFNTIPEIPTSFYKPTQVILVDTETP